MILIFPRYLPDTIQKFSKEPLNAFQIRSRWLPNNIKHLLDSFKMPSKHAPNTFHNPISPDTFKTPSRYLPDAFQTPSTLPNTF